MKKLIVSLLLIGFTLGLQASKLVDDVHPLSWWTDMQHTELQIMLHGTNIAKAEISFKGEALPILRTEKTDNPNYVFLYVDTKDAKAQTYQIQIKKGWRRQILDYTLNERKENSAMRKSFGPQDAVYLIMPDRFANGDTSNDQVKGYAESVQRGNWQERQGGDIQGMMNHLDHIADLGMTAIWTTPIFEDNDTNFSYHHYATSNYYKIDPRFGSNELFKQFVEACHTHNLKYILDIVPNHCATSHMWSKDLPAKDWYNRWDTFTRTNYKVEVATDPHASQEDLKQLQSGWFDKNMADLNLGNPLLFDYMRQVYVYWVEYADIDGLRVDTYPYNNMNNASRLLGEIRKEYPHMNLVGECWVKSPAQSAYYQSGTINKDGFDSNLPSVMDFCLRDFFAEAFHEKESWNTGVIRFYNHLAQDFVYANPNLVMNMADNHDMDRMHAILKNDLKQLKMVTSILCTMRGFPQFYYGDEILIDANTGNYEGSRHTFPGGWSDDTYNAFDPKQRTSEAQEMYSYMRNLLHFRRETPALQTGKMMQFIPRDGIYVYFRYDKKNTVMIITNNQESEQKVELTRFKEMPILDREAFEVTTQQKMSLEDFIVMPGKTTYVLNFENPVKL